MSLPKPYYDKDGITIYHGDCMEILPLLGEVDVTVSSPPYNQISAVGESAFLKNRKLCDGYDGYGDNMNEAEYQEWMVDVFGICLELSKGVVWVNHKTRYRNKAGIHPLRFFSWPLHCEIIWDRRGCTIPGSTRFSSSHETIHGFGEPHYWDKDQSKYMSVWSITPERNIEWHPCPFPMEIARRCILASCPQDGIVLDPFMGSGTTLVAAKKHGRRAIGIELNRAYCDGTVRRLAESGSWSWNPKRKQI